MNNDKINKALHDIQDNQQDLDSEIAKLVDDNFHELVSDPDMEQINHDLIKGIMIYLNNNKVFARHLHDFLVEEGIIK